MEQFILFNGVRILLTTGKRLSEVQNFVNQADVILSVYPDEVMVLEVADHLKNYGPAETAQP